MCINDELINRLQDNVIDFMEFVAAVHLVLRGNLEDRLKWSFKVYDRDENGKLDRQEVIHVIRVRIIFILNHLKGTVQPKIKV